MFVARSADAGKSAVDQPELMQELRLRTEQRPSRSAEMVDLVIISRAYEAPNQKMITTIDQQMQKALEALG